MNRRGFLRFTAAAPALTAIASKIAKAEQAKPIIEPVSDISNERFINCEFTASVGDSIFIPQPDEYIKRLKG